MDTGRRVITISHLEDVVLWWVENKIIIRPYLWHHWTGKCLQCAQLFKAPNPHIVAWWYFKINCHQNIQEHDSLLTWPQGFSNFDRGWSSNPYTFWQEDFQRFSFWLLWQAKFCMEWNSFSKLCVRPPQDHFCKVSSNLTNWSF